MAAVVSVSGAMKMTCMAAGVARAPSTRMAATPSQQMPQKAAMPGKAQRQADAFVGLTAPSSIERDRQDTMRCYATAKPAEKKIRIEDIAKIASTLPVDPSRPTWAEAARTLADQCEAGMLCTALDNVPLGTLALYALDQQGHVLVRLAPTDVHTPTLMNDDRCSIYVQNQLLPRSAVRHATLIGRAKPVAKEELGLCTRLFNIRHEKEYEHADVGGAKLYRITVERVLYVSDKGPDAITLWVDGEEYCAAEPDPLRDVAAAVLTKQNTPDNAVELVRIARHYAGITQEITDISTVGLDRLGVDLFWVNGEGVSSVVRIPFWRPLRDERDARSMLTMMAQMAWESQRA